MKNLLLSFVVCLCLISVAAAQDTLTNQSVLEMVKAGMDEELVLSMIGSQPNKFDVSPVSLMSLKQAGMSNKVLKALYDAGKNPPKLDSSAREANREVPSVAPPSGGLKVQDGTEVKLVLAEDLSSANAKSNDAVKLEVAEDVSVDGKILISKGAPATGTVVQASKAGRFNKPADLTFVAEYVTAVDGTKVRVRSAIGKSGVDMSVVRMVNPVSVFGKGKNIEFPKGTPVRAIVDGDKLIKPRELTAVR